MISRCCLCVCLCIAPIVARQRFGKCPLIAVRQRVGKNPLIVARQRLCKNSLWLLGNCYVLYAARVVSKKIRQLFLPRTSCFKIRKAG
jgi:hypothetical protein